MAGVLWRIYYADLSTFDNYDGSWYDAPWEGVIVINQHSDTYNTGRIWGWDYYYYNFEAKEWWGSSESGALIQLAKYSNTRAALKFGELVSNERFQEVMKLAENDPDFRKPSAGKNFVEHP